MTKFRTTLLAGICLATLMSPAGASTDLATALADLQHGWAKVNYETPADKKEAAFEALTAKAKATVAANPGQAELMAWEAIILSSYAKVQGAFGAIDSAKQARDLLVEAAKIDDTALNGGIYTSLGALYYKVPGWPIGFGDDDKAKENLERGLAMNPTGIDANYFYGDYLLDQGDKKQARTYLLRALEAPDRPGRADADKGRRQEINADLKLAGN